MKDLTAFRAKVFAVVSGKSSLEALIGADLLFLTFSLDPTPNRQGDFTLYEAI